MEYSKKSHIRINRRNRIITVYLVLALTSLACSIGVLSPSDPLFAAPVAESQGSVTPIVLYTQDETDLEAVNSTPEPAATQIPDGEVTPPTMDPNIAPILYYTQAGDTLQVISARFGVDTNNIISPEAIFDSGLLPPNQLLIIPHQLVNTTLSQRILPDSEVVYSPSSLDFDIEAFVEQAGGYLSGYREWLGTTDWTSGAEVIERIAIDNSINPRFLLALLEYQSGWVYGRPANLALLDYPMGKIDLQKKGLYQQLSWAVGFISTGYYGWREGLITDIEFSDGATARLAPDLNAGTVALQYYFAKIFTTEQWILAFDQDQGFPELYERMFGNPWIRVQDIEPLYPSDLTQPKLILPFFVGQVWAFTGGPHGAWEQDGARAALDFSPARTVSGCVDSDAWVLAAASGQVVRSTNGVVVIDLDGDGKEQTGWVLLYLHIATKGRIKVNTWVETGDLLGHPSCEGGRATGTHVHIARKYNGEWIPASGPLPFILDGWVAHAGKEPYQGTLVRNGETVQSSDVGSFESRIIRQRNEP